MSCKNAIYMVNNASQNVATNLAINLGSAQHGFGCGISGSASGVSITSKGVYLVIVDATYTAPATGVVAFSLWQNGQQVPGATVADTITTATTEQNTGSFAAIVNVTNCNTTLSLVNTGIAFTPSNVGMTVVKLK